jgi:hypothetical protein
VLGLKLGSWYRRFSFDRLSYLERGNGYTCYYSVKQIRSGDIGRGSKGVDRIRLNSGHRPKSRVIRKFMSMQGKLFKSKVVAALHASSSGLANARGGL